MAANSPRVVQVLRAARLRASGSEFSAENAQVKLRFAGAKAVVLRCKNKSRTFEGSAYNGGVMFPELTVNGRVENGPVVLDLESLVIPNPQCPVLYDHDETPGAEIGQTTMIAMRKADYTLPVKGVLYPDRPRAQDVLNEQAAGRQWQLSVGTNNKGLQRLAAGQKARINGRNFVGPLTVVRNAVLTDLSFVRRGGDDTTYATIAARRASEERQAAMKRLIVAIRKGPRPSPSA